MKRREGKTRVTPSTSILRILIISIYKMNSSESDTHSCNSFFHWSLWFFGKEAVKIGTRLVAVWSSSLFALLWPLGYHFTSKTGTISNITYLNYLSIWIKLNSRYSSHPIGCWYIGWLENLIVILFLHKEHVYLF